MNSYSKYSKEQLVQLLVTRDEEASSLRVMNREMQNRLREVDAQLQHLLDRLQTLESQNRSLHQKIATIEGASHAAEATLDDLTKQRNAIAEKAEDLEKVLENEIVWRKGFFPYLGMAVEKEDSSNDRRGDESAGLVVKRVAKPALSHGIEEGDKLMQVSYTIQKRMLSVQDYASILTDLPAYATVTLEFLRRNGSRGVVQLTPAIGSYRGSN